MLLRIIIGTVLLLVLITQLVFPYVANQLANGRNVVMPHDAYEMSPKAEALHNSLVIGDIHADSTIWYTNLSERRSGGHVDLPRLKEGNVAIQMFTSITKAPADHSSYEGDGLLDDRLALVALLHRWSIPTWSSAKARAIKQAQQIRDIAEEEPNSLKVIRTANDLVELLARRENGEEIVGGLLGIEGAHAFEGDLNNIDELINAGFTMFAPHHSFDNKLGTSLHHGTSNETAAEGLTEYGLQVIDKLIAKKVLLDVSHSSEQSVEDILARSDLPLIISHTGFNGHCESFRNVSDELMIKVAQTGGLIGVSYGEETTCDITPKGIVSAIRYGIDLVGVDHIGLGSNFDGSIVTTFDTSELAVLTDEMLKANFTEIEIRKVMGGNMVRFLRENLPKN